MKKSILIIALALGGFAFQSADAQLRINIRANFGLQPVWGPVGYDYAEYYYMPDIDVFYNVPQRQYIYQERGRWIFSAYLPFRFRSYDLDRGYKVVVNDPRPYRNAEMYRNKYSSYKNNHDQEIIRDSRDSKYFVIKGHPEHNNWQRGQNQNRRKGNDHRN